MTEIKTGSFHEYCIDIYPTKAQANKVAKQHINTQIIDSLTVEDAKAYAQTTDKFLFVVDTFFDVASIDDVPLSLVERVEDALEQLLAGVSQ